MKTTIKLNHVYCLNAKDYLADYPDGFKDDGTPYHGSAIISIRKEEFETLKNAGFDCKEFTQIVLAATKDWNQQKPVIRQAIFKHIVYVDKVNHTNF